MKGILVGKCTIAFDKVLFVENVSANSAAEVELMVWFAYGLFVTLKDDEATLFHNAYLTYLGYNREPEIDEDDDLPF